MKNKSKTREYLQQNKNGVSTTKSTKGITLIALVITIIVLLILAGVTIAMLSGENGILDRATSTQAYNCLAEAKENILLKANENIELYYDEVYVQQKASGNYTFANLQTAAQAAVNGSGDLASYKATMPSHVTVVSATQIKYENGRQVATVDLTVGSDGKITFQPVAYNGGAGGDTGDTGDTDYSDDVKSKLALKLDEETDDTKSPWVQYNGEKYKVLYNDNNGIEIIKMEFAQTDKYQYGSEDEKLPTTAQEYDFANSDSDSDSDVANFEKARWSYNNLVQNLNQKAVDLYPKNNIIDDARCVGSVPGKTNKNTKNSTPISIPSYLSGKGLEQGEEVVDGDTLVVNQPNYTSDLQRMTDLGILLEESYYLLASRTVNALSSDASFNVCGVDCGGLNCYELCYVNSGSYVCREQPRGPITSSFASKV